MSLELIRESIKINQSIGEESTQVVVENDIIVPDVKPDIGQILYLDGDTAVTGAEALSDKILVNGSVRYKIMYIADDEEKSLKSIDTFSGFNCGLEVPGTKHGMKCWAKCDVEHIEYEILNGRKINIRTIISVNGKVMEESEHSFVTDLDGIEDIQVLKNGINVNGYVGSGNDSCFIKETMEVPAGKPTIREILRNDIKVVGRDYKLTDNKVIVKGELNVSTLYIGDDERQSVQIMEHEMPFTQFVDLPGISDEDNCEVDYKIVEAKFDITEDGDGELRVMNGEVELEIAVEGYSQRRLDILSDAYSPSARIVLEKEIIKLEEPVCDSRSQAVIKDTVKLAGGKPEISEVFNVFCKPVLTECSVLDDKVVVEGVVKNNVLYLANSAEEPISSYGQESAFKHSIDLKGVRKGMKCNVNLDTEHCNYSMVSADEVEIRLVISIAAKVMNQIPCPLLARVTESPMEERSENDVPSIIIYFSQPGDTMWKVAKRYYTTIEDVQRINNLSDHDLISPGQQIIIPRRMK